MVNRSKYLTEFSCRKLFSILFCYTDTDNKTLPLKQESSIKFTNWHRHCIFFWIHLQSTTYIDLQKMHRVLPLIRRLMFVHMNLLYFIILLLLILGMWNCIQISTLQTSKCSYGIGCNHLPLPHRLQLEVTACSHNFFIIIILRLY